jgi:hypothetical protein
LSDTDELVAPPSGGVAADPRAELAADPLAFPLLLALASGSASAAPPSTVASVAAPAGPAAFSPPDSGTETDGGARARLPGLGLSPAGGEVGAALPAALPLLPPFVAVPQVDPTAAQAEPGLDPGALRGLDRAFAARLERVAERLRTEHGLRLEIVEGLRSQLRQNELFTQGRTEPGAVVTWTTNSLHTVGQAADVYVDGAPVTSGAALLLARVAREEGLRTLYPIDSGHIQALVPGGEAGPEGPLPRSGAAPTPGAPPPRRGVAPVAPVAPVAKPATPGGFSLGERPGDEGVYDADRPEARSIGRVAVPSTGRAGTLGAEIAARRPTRPEPTTSTSSAPVPELAAHAFAGAPAATTLPSHVGTASPSSEAASPPALDPARFEVADASRPYRSVQVPLDGVGEGASLRVGLRGTSVDARLTVADTLVAFDLTRGLDELGHQLARRGLDVVGLAVRLVADGVADSESSQNRGSPASRDPLEERERGTRRRRPSAEEPTP